jgi:hypothetical protein
MRWLPLIKINTVFSNTILFKISLNYLMYREMILWICKIMDNQVILKMWIVKKIQVKSKHFQREKEKLKRYCQQIKKSIMSKQIRKLRNGQRSLMEIRTWVWKKGRCFRIELLHRNLETNNSRWRIHFKSKMISSNLDWKI